MKKRLEKLPKESQCILEEVAKAAASLDYRVYLVGGVVRDLLLNRLNYDLDFVVVGSAIVLAQHLANSLGSRFIKHHTFGTATVYFKNHKIDFATSRSERYPAPGVLPKISPAALNEDLFRRDLTINAMAISINSNDYGQLIDFYDGTTDLQKGLIRIMHPLSFKDDPTRILRALRFEQRFSFKLEAETQKLLIEAVKGNFLQLVHPHRLRDELILIFKEKSPGKILKRLNELFALNFLGSKVRLNRLDLEFFSRMGQLIKQYKKTFKFFRTIDNWLVYLCGLTHKFSLDEVVSFVKIFGFKKGEGIRLITAKENYLKLNKLKAKCRPHEIYELLNPLSFETIIFLYVYHKNVKIKHAIKYFMNSLAGSRLKITGSDLKKLKIEPETIYNQIFKELLFAKINKKFTTKEQEIKEAKKIAIKLLRS